MAGQDQSSIPDGKIKAVFMPASMIYAFIGDFD
jgi:hypothetical protein